MDTVELYEDASHEWRWRRQSENGRIVSTSGEGYENHGDAKAMALALNPGCDIADGDIDHSDE